METSHGEQEMWFGGLGDNEAQAGLISVRMISTGLGEGVVKWWWWSNNGHSCHFVKAKGSQLKETEGRSEGNQTEAL